MIKQICQWEKRAANKRRSRARSREPTGRSEEAAASETGPKTMNKNNEEISLRPFQCSSGKTVLKSFSVSALCGEAPPRLSKSCSGLREFSEHNRQLPCLAPLRVCPSLRLEMTRLCLTGLCPHWEIYINRVISFPSGLLTPLLVLLVITLDARSSKRHFLMAVHRLPLL